MSMIRIGSGKLVDPFDLQPKDFEPEVFIHAVCLLNRYTGHTKYPYSVGQHSLVLMNYVPRRLKGAAIIHDLAEALFNDLSSPVKARYPAYKRAEKAAQAVIAGCLRVPISELEEVSPYDKSLYIDERDHLFYYIGEPGQGMNDDKIALGVDPWHLREREWRDVEELFHAEFRALFGVYE